MWLCSLRCYTSRTTLTTLFYFTTIKMKYLTTLTSLFYYKKEISDYAHYAVFLHWLHSLRCFYFTTSKWKSLTTLTTLFYFTATNPRYLTTLTTLLLSLINQVVFPQEFQCFHKVCMCHSSVTFRKFSGVLHALLPEKRQWANNSKETTNNLSIILFNYSLYKVRSV